jgi:hypothetical protein
MFELVTTWGRHVGYYGSVGSLCKASGLTPDEVFDAIENPINGLYVLPTMEFVKWLEKLERDCQKNSNLGMSTVDIAAALGMKYQMVQQVLKDAKRKMLKRARQIMAVEA